MRPWTAVLGELEAALRAEYDAKISALEEERDRKLEACRSLSSVVGNGSADSHPPRETVKKKKPVAARAAAPSIAINCGGTNIERVRNAVQAMTGDFRPADLLPHLRGVDPTIVPPILRRLLELGEVELIAKGAPSRPPVYRATKGKNADVPPSNAARSSRSPSEPAAASA